MLKYIIMATVRKKNWKIYLMIYRNIKRIELLILSVEVHYNINSVTKCSSKCFRICVFNWLLFGNEIYAIVVRLCTMNNWQDEHNMMISVTHCCYYLISKCLHNKILSPHILVLKSSCNLFFHKACGSHRYFLSFV